LGIQQGYFVERVAVCWTINTVAQECCVATGICRGLLCPVLQGAQHDRGSVNPVINCNSAWVSITLKCINPTKMKLCPGVRNPKKCKSTAVATRLHWNSPTH